MHEPTPQPPVQEEGLEAKMSITLTTKPLEFQF